MQLQSRNVRRKHPYAGNKHSQKTATKGRQQTRQNNVQQSSLQRTTVQHSAKQESASLGASHRQGNANKTKTDARGHVLRVPVRGGRRRPSLETWDNEGDVHKLSFMASLREELHMQMWSIHTRYVLTHHKDLQALPERQIRGALQKIWLRLDILRQENA